MNCISCPSCKANVESDLYESAGQTYCPYCGTDLSDFLQIDSFKSTDEFSSEEVTAGSAINSELNPLPRKSRVEIIQASPERLVLHIPPCGKMQQEWVALR